MGTEDNDDEPRGHILSRRDALTLLGVAGAGLLTGCGRSRPPNDNGVAAAGSGAGSGSGAPASAGGPAGGMCVVRPELTEGPYFVDERLNRSDIRSDPSDGSIRPGAPLQLTFRVSSLAGASCTPLAGAMVDIWHCDHAGVYSDATDPSFSTVGRKFLRGYQLADANGVAGFTTIYPGWYPGRAVHIHFKIRSAAAAGRSAEFTSQLFFDEALTDRVFTRAPYSEKGGAGRRRNEDDGIFRRGGSQLVLATTERGDGYAATFTVALQNA